VTVLQQRRRTSEVGRGPLRLPQGRMLPAAAYRELGRKPRLGELPARRPAYLEAIATAAAFLFVLYLVLGGV
jgi:hypothetical protein